MVRSGPPTPMGGSQNVPPSLQSNSGMLEGGQVPSQATLTSPVSPRPQMSDMNVLGNMPNMSSLLGQSFGNNGPNPVFSSSVSSQRGGYTGPGDELNPLANFGNGICYNTSSSSSFLPGNPGTSGQFQGQQFQNTSSQMIPDQSLARQLEQQNFPNGQQAAQQFCEPQKAQIGGLAGLGPVKLEPQLMTEQLQSMKNMNAMKMEPQEIPTSSMRNLPPVKMEPQQHSDSTLFLQQQQPLMLSARQPSPTSQLSFLQQQRLFQFQQQQQQQQQHQQQQLVKALPQQRFQLPQHFQQQSLALRQPPVKPGYEPGMCAKRLTHYLYQQRLRPEDNNIEFWRKFVDEYFARNAKKKWCVSTYGSGRQTSGVFPQDIWHCDICKRKPGRGFEATFEVLPRLFKIEYESGTLEELLYIDMPREYPNSSGQIVLDYAKAIQENVLDQLRVVREGQLRVIFSPDLKICSWEFCARRHDELIPRRLLLPQVNQLGAVAQKYQAASQNASSTVPELQNNCNMFLSSARQLAKALEVPLVNDLGYTKRFVRCLQISEVVNCMKDLIAYSQETGTGPMESLAKFPRRSGATSVSPRQAHLPHEQLQQQSQQLAAASLNMNGGHQSSSPQSGPMQLPVTSNGVGPGNSPASTSGSSSSTIAGLHHQNSMNSEQQNSMNNNRSSLYNGAVQNQSPGLSGPIPPTHSGNNNDNAMQTSQSALLVTTNVGSANSLPNINTQLGEPEQNSMPESSVQKILQNMISSPNQSGGSIVNHVTSGNGPLPAGMNPGPGMVNANGSLLNGGYGPTGVGGMGQAAMMVNRFRAATGNTSLMSGRVGMSSMIRDHSMNHLQQQDLGIQMMNGLRPTSSRGFSDNLQYDWKPTP